MATLTETVAAAKRLAKLEIELQDLKAALPWPPARCPTCGRREAKVDKPEELVALQAKVNVAREQWRTEYRDPSTQTMPKQFMRELRES